VRGTAEKEALETEKGGVHFAEGDAIQAGNDIAADDSGFHIHDGVVIQPHV
jgi:hypothetical protein